MQDKLTVDQLESRWLNVLMATDTAFKSQPSAYLELKSLLVSIINHPLDIKDYLPTAEKIVHLLKDLDPKGQGSLFHYFKDRFTPSNVWQIAELRLDCRDLLDHLTAFDKWRLDKCHLRLIQ
jgi:hypothetical protein